MDRDQALVLITAIDQLPAHKQNASGPGADCRLQGCNGDRRGNPDRMNGISHLRIRGHADEITRAEQGAAPGDCRPLYRDYHHRHKASNSAIDVTETLDVASHHFRLLCGPPQIESRAEYAALPPEQDHPQRFVSFDRRERLVQLIKHGDPQGVALFGIVEGKNREVVIDREGDRGVGHRCMVAGWENVFASASLESNFPMFAGLGATDRLVA